MRIAMIASECVPFAKTGGLADVVGALPKALGRLGREAIVILPLYGSIDYRGRGLELWMAQIGVWMGNTLEWCAVHRGVGDGGTATYFIQHDRYFDRDGLYHDPGFNDYPDNPRRFALFSRAALQLLIDMHWMPDIIHAHD